MTYLVNLADCRDPDNPQGRSFRQVNAERQHEFAIGSLVEDTETGVRVFVVEQTRDCDMSPMYTVAMSYDPDFEPDHIAKARWSYGWSADYGGLRLVRGPQGVAE